MALSYMTWKPALSADRAFCYQLPSSAIMLLPDPGQQIPGHLY